MFRKKETEKVKAEAKLLGPGDELKLVMKDYSRRVVTVMRLRQDGMRVKELFHGIYDLPYDDIRDAYIGDELYAGPQLRRLASACARH